MRKMLLTLLVISLYGAAAYAQLNQKAQVNVRNLAPTLADSLKPYSTDKGARTVWVSNDLDGDGKLEVLATDYTGGGRVHVYEFTTPTTLELVWSSPRRPGISSGSTPRWVRTGDLDGDGAKEIIFPLTTGSADFEVEVYEYTGTNNDYGTAPAFTLPKDYFSARAVGNFRTNREVGNVYDFDNDGKSELIMSNRDHNVYVLGVSGTFPGFAAWELEGGDPTVVPVNSSKFSISHWHSVPADVDGDGKKEIVNHMWNRWGLWSIKPRGIDSYSYPDTGRANFYREYTTGTYGDHVAYMGIQPADVDGDGKDEIAGILYGGDSAYYALYLTSLDRGDTGLYNWKTGKSAIIARDAWTVSGETAGSFWGIGAADLNGNGKTEILLGGTGKYDIVSVEYKGTGSLLDESSYTKKVAYAAAAPMVYAFVNIYDSARVKKDTVRTEAPFVAKMFAGFDSNNDGKKEVAVAYQSVYDSITYKYYYRGATDTAYRLDSTVKKLNTSQINIKVLEYNATGLEDRGISFITPENYILEPNFPNPFNPSTSIRFELPVDKKISLRVYDMLGREVKTLIDNADYLKGKYSVTWNGTNNAGVTVASGSYIAELRFGNFTKSVKMSLLK